MNDSYNPYNNNVNMNPQNPQQNYPQPNVPPQNYPQPNVPPQGYPQPQVPQQIYTPQQKRAELLAEREQRLAAKAKGQAKGYGYVSLIIGCVSLIACAMILFNFQLTVSDKWYWALKALLFLGLPGGIAGVISIAKKPDNKLITVLGLVFAGVMLVCALSIYFYAANTGAHLYWFAQAKQ